MPYKKSEILSRLEVLDEYISKADADDLFEEYLDCYPQLREYMKRPTKKDFKVTDHSPYVADFAEMEAAVFARTLSCKHVFNIFDATYTYCLKCGIEEDFYSKNKDVGATDEK